MQMIAETDTTDEMEQIDVATQDLLDVLAEVVMYERTNGATRLPRMAVIGDDTRRMAVPESSDTTSNVLFDATRLVEDGDVVESLAINGQIVELNIV